MISLQVFPISTIDTGSAWTGSQKYGFVIRQVDKGTSWTSRQTAVAQNLAISTVGYPFVETNMIGGSLGQPPPTLSQYLRRLYERQIDPKRA